MAMQIHNGYIISTPTQAATCARKISENKELRHLPSFFAPSESLLNPRRPFIHPAIVGGVCVAW